MEKDIINFLEEITDNFTSLFVEAFMIRYEYLFNKQGIKNKEVIIKMLSDKLSEKFDEINAFNL